MHNLTKIVKTALNKKIEISLNSKDYYLNEDLLDRAVNLLYGKHVAFKDLENRLYTTKISSKDDYVKIIKTGAISIYEPVSTKTKYFTAWLNDGLSKSECLNILSLSKSKIAETLNAKVDIIKSAASNKYGFSCILNDEINTNEVISKLSFLDSYIDKRDLTIGNLKKFCYSLRDNGKKDIQIEISGEIE